MPDIRGGISFRSVPPGGGRAACRHPEKRRQAGIRMQKICKKWEVF